MPLVSSRKAVKLLGVHPNTLRNWHAAGKIKAIRTEAGQRLYDVDEYLERERLHIEAPKPVWKPEKKAVVQTTRHVGTKTHAAQTNTAKPKTHATQTKPTGLKTHATQTKPTGLKTHATQTKQMGTNTHATQTKPTGVKTRATQTPRRTNKTVVAQKVPFVAQRLKWYSKLIHELVKLEDLQEVGIDYEVENIEELSNTQLLLAICQREIR